MKQKLRKWVRTHKVINVFSEVKIQIICYFCGNKSFRMSFLSQCVSSVDYWLVFTE